MRQAWAVAVKEMRQIRRDRRTLMILIFVPTFFLFLYGYALNFDIRHVTLGVQDRDGSSESRSRSTGASFGCVSVRSRVITLRQLKVLSRNQDIVCLDSCPNHTLNSAWGRV